MTGIIEENSYKRSNTGQKDFKRFKHLKLETCDLEMQGLENKS
jgi:hypothetical protein